MILSEFVTLKQCVITKVAHHAGVGTKVASSRGGSNVACAPKTATVPDCVRISEGESVPGRVSGSHVCGTLWGHCGLHLLKTLCFAECKSVPGMMRGSHVSGTLWDHCGSHVVISF